MRTPEESFVVRIYRCQGGKGQHLVGVVNAPRFAGSRAFTSVAQLWEILAECAPAMPSKRRGRLAAGYPNDKSKRQFDPAQESED